MNLFRSCPRARSVPAATPLPVRPRRPRRVRVSIRALAVLAGTLLAAAAAAQGPVSVVPILDGEATDAFVWSDLANGRTVRVERLRRDPRVAEISAVSPGLFEAVGRPSDQAARPGEVHLAAIDEGGKVKHGFFAEASTGYVAYFQDFARGGSLGTVRNPLGRPFGPIAGSGGSYLLLARRDRGRTDGFYLVDATYGRGLYLAGARELAMEPELAATTATPQLPGLATAAALDFEGSTFAYLVADGEGGLHRFFLDRDRPERLDPRRLELDLFAVFPRDAERSSDQRFHLMPLHDRRGSTTEVLVVDAGSGQTALVAEPGGSGPPRLVPLAHDLDAYLPPDGARSFGVVPRRDGSGATVGAWVVDGPSQSVLYLDRPATPAESTLGRVTLSRR